MKFKVDENMPADLVTHLREAGHDVASVVDEELGGEEDTALLAAATAEQRIQVVFR